MEALTSDKRSCDSLGGLWRDFAHIARIATWPSLYANFCLSIIDFPREQYRDDSRFSRNKQSDDEFLAACPPSAAHWRCRWPISPASQARFTSFFVQAKRSACWRHWFAHWTS